MTRVPSMRDMRWLVPADKDKEEPKLPSSSTDTGTEKRRSQGREQPMRATKKAEAKEAQNQPAPRHTAVARSFAERMKD